MTLEQKEGERERYSDLDTLVEWARFQLTKS